MTPPSKIEISRAKESISEMQFPCNAAFQLTNQLTNKKKNGGSLYCCTSLRIRQTSFIPIVNFQPPVQILSSDSGTGLFNDMELKILSSQIEFRNLWPSGKSITNTITNKAPQPAHRPYDPAFGGIGDDRNPMLEVSTVELSGVLSLLLQSLYS